MRKREELVNQSINYRGRILHEFTWFENMLDTYIAKHFCSGNLEKMDELYLTFLGENRTTIGGKAEVFKFIVERHDKEWYNGYKATNSDMYKDMEYIISERNTLAHRMLDTSNEALLNDNAIVFTRVNLKYTDQVFDNTRFSKDFMILDKLIKYLYVKNEV